MKTITEEQALDMYFDMLDETDRMSYSYSFDKYIKAISDEFEVEGYN